MLKCREIAQLGSDYLDHGLSRGQRFSLALHLLMCGHCRAFIRHLKLSLQFYARLSDEDEQLSSEETEDIARKVTGKD